MAGRHAEELCPREGGHVGPIRVWCIRASNILYLKEEVKQKRIEHLEENFRILSEMARTKGGNGPGPTPGVGPGD